MRRGALGLAVAGALAWSAGCGTVPTRSSVPGDTAELDERPSDRRWEVIGFSHEERPVRAMDLGTSGPRIAFLAGIHGDEREGLRHLDEVLDVLSAHPVRARVIEDVNPDGTAANRRTTSTGVDPNRNWPALNFRADPRRGPSPLSEPGVAAVHADLVKFDPQLVIVLHSTPRGPFVNYDGPAEGFARRFAVAAGDPWRVQASMGYPTPGSLGSWFGVDRGLPILTIEFDRGCSPEESGPALLRGLEAILRDGPAPAVDRVD